MKFPYKLFIEGYNVDLSEDLQWSFVFNIDDIDNISTIPSNYSRTISNIPGTANNNKLFNYLWNPKAVGTGVSSSLNIGANYDFKRKARAYVICNNQQVFSGYARLTAAGVKNGLASYEILIVSDQALLMSALGDKRLEDLYPSSGSVSTPFDHDLLLSNITGSWQYSSSDSAMAAGKPYLWPIADYGYENVNASNFYTTELRPCMYIKSLFDLCISSSGFSYSSSFISSSYFNSLVMPYSMGQFNLNKLSVIDTSTSGSISGSNLSQSVIIRNYDQNNLDLFSGTYGSTFVGGRFQPVVSGIYNFSVSFTFDFNWTSFNEFIEKLNRDIFGYIRVSSYKQSDDSFQRDSYATFKYVKNQDDFFGTSDTSSLQGISETVSNYVGVDEYAKIGISFSSIYQNFEYFSNADDVTSEGSGSVNVYANNRASLKIDSSTQLDGNTITFGQYVPKNILQRDFVSSILRMLNLYPVPDVDRPKHFNILTHDEFYSNQDVIDWTSRLDKNSDFKVTPIPQLSNGFLLYSYRQDKDYYNQLYSSLYPNAGIYGQARVNLNYDFANDVKDVMSDVIFSPTVPVQYANTIFPSEHTAELNGTNVVSVTGYSASLLSATTSSVTNDGFTKARKNVKINLMGGIYSIVHQINLQQFVVDRPIPFTGAYFNFKYITNNNKVIPTFFDSKDNNVSRTTLQCNPRILFYNGLRNCNPYIIQYTPFYSSISASYFSGGTGSAYFTSQSVYPYVSHIHDTLNKDLLYLQPAQTFFTAGTYPTSSLFEFHRNSVNEIADPEAKKIECSLKLSSVDVSNLDLSQPVQIEGTNYRVSQIEYNPDPSQLAKAVLVRKPYQQYSNTSFNTPPPITSSAFVSASVFSNASSSIDSIKINSVNVTYVNGNDFEIGTGGQGLFQTGQTGNTNTITVNVNRKISESIFLVDSSGSTTSTQFGSSGNADVIFNNKPIAADGLIYVYLSGSSGTGSSAFEFITIHNSQSAAQINGVYVDGIAASNFVGSLPVTSGSFTILKTFNTGSSRTIRVNVSATTGSLAFNPFLSSAITASVSGSGNYYFNNVNMTNDTAELRFLSGSAPGVSINTTIQNNLFGSVINTVSGISGYSFPTDLNYTQTTTGVHGVFNNTIQVHLSASSAGVIYLQKNGSTLQILTWPSGFNGYKTFSSFLFNSLDQLKLTTDSSV